VTAPPSVTARHRVLIWDLAAIRRALHDLGLESGLPDLFSGGRGLPQTH
jgi:hypothetical protein